MMQDHEYSSADKKQLAYLIARDLRWNVICAHSSIDRSLAAVIGIPYETILQERWVFGRAQSQLRLALLASKADADFSRRSTEEYTDLCCGLELMLKYRFGISPSRKPRIRRDGAFAAIKRLYRKFSIGEYGDQDDHESFDRLALEIGRTVRMYSV